MNWPATIILVGVVLGASGAIISGVGALMLQQRNDRLQQDEARLATHRHEAVLAKLTPFESLAKERFPTLSIDDALDHLRRDLSEVRELASRDIPKQLTRQPRDVVVENLRRLQQGPNAPVLVIVDRLNVSSPRVQEFLAQVTTLLSESGIPQQEVTTAGMSASVPPPPPYRIRFAPGMESIARAFAEALRPYITSEPVLTETPNLQRGVYRITVVGEITFLADGSVVVR
jgi:hypothetical protein